MLIAKGFELRSIVEAMGRSTDVENAIAWLLLEKKPVSVDDAVAETRQRASDEAFVGTRRTFWTLTCRGLKRPLSPEDLVGAVRRVSVRRRTKLQAQDTVYDLRTIRLLTAATSAAKARMARLLEMVPGTASASSAEMMADPVPVAQTLFQELGAEVGTRLLHERAAD